MVGISSSPGLGVKQKPGFCVDVLDDRAIAGGVGQNFAAACAPLIAMVLVIGAAPAEQL